MCLVEEPKVHILPLMTHGFMSSKSWNLSTDTSPLMEGIDIVLNGKVTQDKIYEELMKQNEELDELTEECLQVLCHSCAILLK